MLQTRNCEIYRQPVAAQCVTAMPKVVKMRLNDFEVLFLGILGTHHYCTLLLNRNAAGTIGTQLQIAVTMHKQAEASTKCCWLITYCVFQVTEILVFAKCSQSYVFIQRDCNVCFASRQPIRSRVVCTRSKEGEKSVSAVRRHRKQACTSLIGSNSKFLVWISLL